MSTTLKISMLVSLALAFKLLHLIAEVIVTHTGLAGAVVSIILFYRLGVIMEK